MRFRLSGRAKADIRRALAYISARNPRAALGWKADLDVAFDKLGRNPGLGATRFERRANLRLLPVGRYVVLYLHDGGDAVVLRVPHGSQDWWMLV